MLVADRVAWEIALKTSNGAAYQQLRSFRGFSTVAVAVDVNGNASVYPTGRTLTLRRVPPGAGRTRR